MLIAVLALGGAMLAATTIAGLLLLYQLRATTNSVHSSESIFAADTGIQWALFDYYCGQETPSRCQGDPPEPPTQLRNNGATISVTCYDASGDALSDCTDVTRVDYAVSRGASLGTARAFYLLVAAATSTFP